MQSPKFAEVLSFLAPEGGEKELLEVCIRPIFQDGAVLEDITCIILERDTQLHCLFIIGKCTSAGPTFKKHEKATHAGLCLVDRGLTDRLASSGCSVGVGGTCHAGAKAGVGGSLAMVGVMTVIIIILVITVTRLLTTCSTTNSHRWRRW